jgi:hypothetical protein
MFNMSLGQLFAHRAVRHSERLEAVGPKMATRQAFERESEAVGVAVAYRKATDRVFTGVDDLT